jgi:potassium uptake Trk family protein
LNGVDLLLFVVLDLNNLYLKEIPVGYRVLDGLFQAFSTRTAGFSVLSISELHPSVQLAYVIMMYISVLPIAISIRRTNVYEEQSLGIYLKDESIEPDLEKTPRSYIGTHVRNQLSFDLWYIFLGIFIICIAEGGKITAQDNTMTIFSVMFEVVSAYGTVGLSLGYPGINASLSGAFTTLSKLVIIAMMIRGRHRGLPYTVDRAIMLPNQNMKRHDRLQESHAIRRHQTLERANTTTSNHLEAGETDNLLTRVLTLDDNLFRRRRSTAGHLAHSMSRPTHLRKPSSVSLLNQA